MTPIIKLISNKKRILIIIGKGKNITETTYNPIPMPLEAFEKIFKNLYLVKPTILRIIGAKKTKDIRYNTTKL